MTEPVRITTVRMPASVHARMVRYANFNEMSINAAVNALLGIALDVYETSEAVVHD